MQRELTPQQNTQPWELDPEERGVTGNADMVEFFAQLRRCEACPILGRSAIKGTKMCAARMEGAGVQNGGFRARTRSMKTCEDIIAVDGYGAIPVHGYI